jgi:hypothetical protein
MEALLLIGVLIGLLGLVLAVAFYARLWSTLGMHRQAMRELHLYLNDRRASMNIPPRQPLGHIPPQEGRP